MDFFFGDWEPTTLRQAGLSCDSRSKRLNEDKKRQALGPFVWRMANGGGVALAHR